MLSRTNSITWMGENIEEQNATISWSKNPNNNNNNVVAVDHNVNDVNGVSLSPFDVENEWLNFNSNIPITRETMNFNLPLIDSSSSCSPSPSVAFNPAALDPSQLSYLLTSKGNNFNLPQSFNNLGCPENGGFFQEGEIVVNRGNGGVLGGFSDFPNNNNNNEIVGPNLGSNPHFSNTNLVQMGGNNVGFGLGSGSGSDPNSKFRGFEEGLMNTSVFTNRTSKLLKPLDNSAPVGGQPTLFQKRAALRKNFSANSNGSGNERDIEKKRKIDDVGFDGPGFNYDSDDFTETNTIFSANGSGKSGGANSNGNSTVSGVGVGVGDKGKKKGPPAKNLMAERRRRKKLNDRLYMLRSIVPKISKMDRASILGDAIEYLKELLQKITDLHNELESSPCASTLTQTANFYPLTPTLPNLPSRIKEELYPSPVPSPHAQPARIEVRSREGRAVNIHMFCGRKPGLLLSTVRALDGLGLDIQQAVISCFNGFAMDIFRAELCKDGQDVHPEQIRGLLMDVAAFHGSNLVGN